jgi:hypothetical protein
LTFIDLDWRGVGQSEGEGLRIADCGLRIGREKAQKAHTRILLFVHSAHFCGWISDCGLGVWIAGFDPL